MLASSPCDRVCLLAALWGSLRRSFTPGGTPAPIPTPELTPFSRAGGPRAAAAGGSGGGGGSFQMNMVVFCLGPSEMVDVDILAGSLGGLGGPVPTLPPDPPPPMSAPIISWLWWRRIRLRSTTWPCMLFSPRMISCGFRDSTKGKTHSGTTPLTKTYGGLCLLAISPPLVAIHR